MGLFTTTDDQHLREAKKQVVPGDTVCPSCKGSVSLSGETLTQWNGSLGIEGHACPSCGQTITRRRPSSDGL